MTVRQSILDNGLRVVTDDMPGLASATVGVWVEAGARHEREDENGLSHLLEHMAFKGTERRDARRIAEEIERVGGQLNAYTGRETTAYYARVLKEDVPLAADILADILFHSVFDEEELRRERDVVVQEIAQAHDTPDDIVFDHLQAACFPGQPLGRSILGPAERVQGFGAEDLRRYTACHYHSANMVLAAAGAVDHDALCEQAAELFPASGTTSAHVAEAGRYDPREHRDERPLEQAHVTLALPGVSYDDDDFHACQILASVLGGGMSSRLFQEIREKRGLAYSVYAYATSYRDCGTLSFYAGTAPEMLPEMVPVLCGELHKAAAEIDEEETARARAQMKASLLMSLESSSSRVEQLARQVMIWGRPRSIGEITAALDAVKAEDLRRVMVRLLQAGEAALAAVGDLEKLEKRASIAARLKR